MRINWKLRLQNKYTLASLIGAFLVFVYQVLGILDVVPAISQDAVTNFVTIALDLLFGLGIIVDPTTKGVSDSDRAMTYDDLN